MLKRSEDNIRMMTITVGDLMRKKVDTIEETASIQATAKKMKDKKVSSLLVLDINGKPIGLVTERDLVRKVCINDVRTSEVTNQGIMSSPLITIDSNSSPSTAADMMLRHNVRHLLVIDDKSVDLSKHIGMITPLDFTKYREYTRDGEHKDAIEEILEYYI
jgi:CBS domain-containing protein